MLKIKCKGHWVGVGVGIFFFFFLMPQGVAFWSWHTHASMWWNVHFQDREANWMDEVATDLFLPKTNTNWKFFASVMVT